MASCEEGTPQRGARTCKGVAMNRAAPRRRAPGGDAGGEAGLRRAPRCRLWRGASFRPLGITIVAVLLSTTSSSPQDGRRGEEEQGFLASLEPGQPLLRHGLDAHHLVRRLHSERAAADPPADASFMASLEPDQPLRHGHYAHDLARRLHSKLATADSPADASASPPKKAAAASKWQWSTREDVATQYKFQLTMGGGDGLKLPASILQGVPTTFTVANCSWLDRGATLPVPGEDVPLGTTVHHSSGFPDMCLACDPAASASASLHRAQDGSVVVATYQNCSMGNYTFAFTLETAGIWDLRVTVGDSALETTIVRVEEPAQAEGEGGDPSAPRPVTPASIVSGPAFYLRQPGFTGAAEGAQGMVALESRGWVGGQLGVAGLNGSLCGLDVGLRLTRVGLATNGTVLACRGVGIDPATGKPTVFGGFGLPKGNNISTTLSCAQVWDAQGRCEIYFLGYSAPVWGEYYASIGVAGQAILAGRTFSVNIFPPASYPWFNTTTLVASRDDWQYMDALAFSLLPRNAAGERLETCNAPVAAFISKGDVSVKANVTCEVQQQQHAVYSIEVARVLEDGTWFLSAMLDGRHVLHSPLTVEIRPGVSARHSELHGGGMVSAVAGVPADVYLRMMLHKDKPATDCREPVYLVLVQTWETVVPPPDVEQAPADVKPAEVMHMSVSGEVIQCSGGEYHLSYTATAAGNYTMSVLIGRHKDGVTGTPTNVQVFPGALSSQHCGVLGGKLGDGTLLYGSFGRFELYLHDSYGNYISCEHYYAGLARHNISELSVYHEPGDDDSSTAWTTPATIGACHDKEYVDGDVHVTDGVLDVSFRLPPTKGETLAKAIAIDLEVRVNGKRLKQGPYTTSIRPARLSPQACTVNGDGIRGAQPGEEKIITVQLINELGENMTTCGSLAAVTGFESCSSLQNEDMCKAREDCDWTVLPPDAGACSSREQKELVELYLKSMQADGSEEDQGLEKLSGTVKACDHGLYTLSYTVKEQGRLQLHVVVGSMEVAGSPFRIHVGPGCRSGAVSFPCHGRGVCGENGDCTCNPGYLGVDCGNECPGLEADGTFCSGRGNCTEEGECMCAYGFIGRLCHMECPGGSGNVCNGNGLCLESGECQCLRGYGGEKCQFKNREVANFGSMSAFIIVLTMLVLTIILVGCVVVKGQGGSRYRKMQCLVKNRAQERRMGSYKSIVTDDDDVPMGGLRRAQNLLDRCADGVLDCVSYTGGLRVRRQSKGTDPESGSAREVPMQDIEQ